MTLNNQIFDQVDDTTEVRHIYDRLCIIKECIQELRITMELEPKHKTLNKQFKDQLKLFKYHEAIYLSLLFSR